MYVEAKGIATFKVVETDELIEVHADSLEWDWGGEGERQMGGEFVHTAEYEVAGKTVTWRIWEYPEGSENSKETDVPSGLELVSDIEYCLEHDPEQDDEN